MDVEVESPLGSPLGRSSPLHGEDVRDDFNRTESELDFDSPLVSPNIQSPTESDGPDTTQLLEFVNSRLSSAEPEEYGSDVVSMASSDSREGKTSLFYDVVQAQLTLWTCVFSLLYSYAWRQHRKKFIMSIFFIIPTVFTVSCIISCLLTAIVVLGRIFSTPFAYNEFLNLKNRILPVENSGESTPMRKRSYSGASSVSWQSEQDVLPRPLCRRHSTSTGSVNGSRPPSRKLSYCYSHFSAGDEQPAE